MLGTGFLLIVLGELRNEKWIRVERTDSASIDVQDKIPMRKPDVMGNFLLVLGIITWIILGLEFFGIFHIINN